MSVLNNKSFAVFVNDLSFSYTKCDSILNGINLSVKRGNIYGLLGPSGCGKTTLLKCILGRLKPREGQIRVFGNEPGTPQSFIPGPGVGYMPQELGLYMEFTIEEILTYFGKIYSMNKIDIKEKFKEITQLLDLPQNNKIIAKYSGGQKRRISLACALIHSPPLLILDEPTVGTDPILRESIITHLVRLCSMGITVILTTHYIEEARNANVVAFMRSGRILAEDNPNILLNTYSSTTLEEVFLKLSHIEDKKVKNKINNTIDIVINGTQNVTTNGLYKELNANHLSIENGKNPQIDIAQLNWTNDSHQIKHSTINGYNNRKYSTSRDLTLKTPSLSDKCLPLLHKNFKRLSRNWIQLIFFLILPCVQLILGLYSIGDRPSNINIAVFNQETISNISNPWGHLFIESIDNKSFVIKEFDSLESAIDSVKTGQTFAAIYINDRFSKSFRLRAIYGSDADNETLEESQIRVHIDWSNQLIALQVERYLYEAIMKFAEKVAIRSDVNPDTIKIPLQFENPVYGIRDESLKDFVLPGLYVLLAFFSTCVVATNMILEERQDGILERSLVAGITAYDFLISHALTQFLILCIQIVFFLTIPSLLFSIQLKGSLILLIAILLSQGICGTFYGMLLSAISSDILYGAMFAILSFLVAIILGGIFWPIYNMPQILQFCGKLIPTTLSVTTMRSILYREWDLTHYDVYMGFISTYVWLILFFITSLILMKKNY